MDSDDVHRELIRLDGVPSLHGYPVDRDVLRLSEERRQQRHERRTGHRGQSKSLLMRMLSRLKTASRMGSA
jgi:hypothetical protein